MDSPWAILPEVDYLYLGPEIEELFMEDLASGAWRVEWGERSDLARAHEIASSYRSLRLGLVDAIVMAVAGSR